MNKSNSTGSAITRMDMKMKKTNTSTTKEMIVAYLEPLSWTSGSELENMSDYWRCKASTVSRRARELYEGGQLDRKLVKGCVWYKKRPNLLTETFFGGVEPVEQIPQLFETPKRFDINPKAK